MRTIQWQIWFRMVRFTARSWAFPFTVGAGVGALANLTGMAWLTQDILKACGL